MAQVSDWFLSTRERGNHSTSIDRGRPPGVAWTTGNRVRPLVHGADYFEAVASAVGALGPGSHLWIADWRGDEDESLRTDGLTLGHLLIDACHRGVQVRGLLWRSHPALFGFSEGEQSNLAGDVNAAGGQLLLDERVRHGGSHHQKMVLLLHPEAPENDIAFVGGIDLCHGRRDDIRHLGDPQPAPVGDEYGEQPPWHDIQVELRGPAVADVAETFRERWNDRTPLERRGSPLHVARRMKTGEARLPAPLPAVAPAPSIADGHAIQVLRTYPAKRPGYPFALKGERSIARLYLKALEQARSLIYVEDQYFWSAEIARAYEGALTRTPELHLIAVVPRFPDRNGLLSGPANRYGQLAMLDLLVRRHPDRVAVYDLENEAGTPIYVHAKAVVIDDVLAVLGSDNMNLRSWTHDSELSIAVCDPESPDGREEMTIARALRVALWREHLGHDAVGEGRLDPAAAFATWKRSANSLEQWHHDGERGDRPIGRIRPHRPRELSAWQRPWAGLLYRAFVDPDGRPASMPPEAF
jgi:phosphatidylserine/phosphatidylglycerophosphate/cardiolipin synthase-like enzyme